MEKATTKSTIKQQNFKAPQTTTDTNQHHPNTFFFIQCKKEGKNKNASEVYLMIYEEKTTDASR